MRKLIVKERSNLTFSGEYLSFKDVFDNYPLATNYHSKCSLQDIVNSARQIISNFKRGDIPSFGWESFRLNILPAILSAIAKKDVLRVIDIGGGLGASFINLKFACPQIMISYTIFDLAETAEQGKELFRDFPDIEFISEFPQEHENFDVLLFGSSLQYFENYRDIIKTTCSYKPEIIILTDHPMGIVDTFVCAQVNMPDRVIPVKVFNLEEIIRIFDTHGYDLILKTISHYPFHDFLNYENDVSKSMFYNLIFKRGILRK